MNHWTYFSFQRFWFNCNAVANSRTPSALILMFLRLQNVRTTEKKDGSYIFINSNFLKINPSSKIKSNSLFRMTRHLSLCLEITPHSQGTLLNQLDTNGRTHSSLRRLWFTCKAVANSRMLSSVIMFLWRL